MLVIPLQSGSNGNCIYVEADGVRLLLDAGISGIQAQTRLGQFGRSIQDLDGVLISHDHADHSRCAGIYHRKFKTPIHVTSTTLAATRKYCSLGRLENVQFFEAGRSVQFGSVRVETIPTPHDASDGVAFVVDDGKRRLGVLTDLGHPFEALPAVLGSLDAVLIESNYDEQMLETGPYPYYLKRRIRGPGGHLSNVETAHLLRQCLGGRMQWACLGHLSEQNNTPERAMDTARDIVGAGLSLCIASRYGAVGPMEI